MPVIKRHLIALALLLTPSVQLAAQSKACGIESPPEPKSWKNVPCEVAPESSDARLRALRRARDAVFDDPTGMKRPEDLAPNPSASRGRSAGFPLELPPLPVSESDAVIIGKVVRYQPYFSNDRTAIYHELTVEIQSVLKDKSYRAVGGDTLAILGEGGSLRLPDGRIFTDFVPPQIQDDIRVGGRYVLFLLYRSNGDYFARLKAWELRAGRVVPMAFSDLRKAQAGKLPLAGMPEAAFLAEVRDSVLRSP